MADFLLKFANFCCYGNKGGSNKNFDDSLRLAYPKYPQFGAKILHVSLTVPELWLFKVAIGCNANFQILGLKGVTKPYKE